jgi:hypothetical protein
MNDTFTRLLARPWHFVRLDRGTKKARTSWNTDPVAAMEAGSFASERATSARRQDEDEEATADPDLADAP